MDARSRIDDALKRIEQSLDSLQQKAASAPALIIQHRQLKSEVSAAISNLDQLIARQQDAG